MNAKARLKLRRCLMCWRRGYHEVKADETVCGLFCDKHAAEAMEAMAPVAEEIVVEYDNGLRVTRSRGEAR